MDYIYKVEEFNPVINKISQKNGWQSNAQKPGSEQKPRLSIIGLQGPVFQTNQTIIAERFEKDIDTFKYTF